MIWHGVKTAWSKGVASSEASDPQQGPPEETESRDRPSGELRTGRAVAAIHPQPGTYQFLVDGDGEERRLAGERHDVQASLPIAVANQSTRSWNGTEAVMGPANTT